MLITSEVKQAQSMIDIPLMNPLCSTEVIAGMI